jgi:hypothetical protein
MSVFYSITTANDVRHVGRIAGTDRGMKHDAGPDSARNWQRHCQRSEKPLEFQTFRPPITAGGFIS